MISIHVKGGEIGCGLLENGNAGVFTLDRQANLLVTIEFEPEAWKRFLQQAPRLKGIGIPVVGAAHNFGIEDGAN